MGTSLEQWRAVTQDPRVVGFFKGTFERAGVRITDTGESFTCIHRGDHVEFEPALNESTTDFTVELKSAEAERFAQSAGTGELDALEQYRAVRALFTPATRATLRQPMLANGVLRRLARVEPLIHVRLVSPDPAQEPDTTHTLIHVGGQWLVIPGLHGRPRRTFELAVSDAVGYQRHVLRALRQDSWPGWIGFGTWYLRWRPSVSRR
ncbi:MAG TPA: hypothetical protein VF998_02765 [Candidatus Limnocylindria bacterium]